MAEAETDLQKSLREQHPIFDRYAGEWNFFYVTYRGGGDYIHSSEPIMLFKHARERQEDYTNRLKRAYHVNFCAPVIDRYRDTIFKNNIGRDIGDRTELQEFITNVDRAGGAIDAFMKVAVQKALVLGLHFVGVDFPWAEQAPATEEDRRKLGINPFWYHIDRRTVWDWEVDQHGNLAWIKIRDVRTPKESPLAPREKSQVTWRIWTDKEWIILNANGDILSRGTHNFGEVPIVPLYFKNLGPMDGQSLLADLAYLNRSIFNYASLLDEELYLKTFTQDVVVGGDRDKLFEQNRGASNLIWLPDGSQWVSTGADKSQADSLREQVDKCLKLMAMISKSGGRAFSEAVEKTRAEIQDDQSELDQALSGMADNGQEAEGKLFRLSGRALGREKEWTVNPDYPDTFDVVSLSQEIENVFKLLELQISPTFSKELKKGVVRKRMAKLAPKVLQTIDEEIESGELPESLNSPDVDLEAAFAGAEEAGTV